MIVFSRKTQSSVDLLERYHRECENNDFGGLFQEFGQSQKFQIVFALLLSVFQCAKIIKNFVRLAIFLENTENLRDHAVQYEIVHFRKDIQKPVVVSIQVYDSNLEKIFTYRPSYLKEAFLSKLQSVRAKLFRAITSVRNKL